MPAPLDGMTFFGRKVTGSYSIVVVCPLASVVEMGKPVVKLKFAVVSKPAVEPFAPLGSGAAVVTLIG